MVERSCVQFLPLKTTLSVRSQLGGRESSGTNKQTDRNYSRLMLRLFSVTFFDYITQTIRFIRGFGGAFVKAHGWGAKQNTIAICDLRV